MELQHEIRKLDNAVKLTRRNLALLQQQRKDKAELLRLYEIIDRLGFKEDECRGCGVDRLGDWGGEHNPGCYVAAAESESKAGSGGK